MEKVYRIKSGDLINVRAKFAEFSKELCPDTIERLPQTYDDIKTLLDIQSGQEEYLLEESISLNNLAQPGDLPIFDVNLHELHSKQGNKTISIPKKAMQLKCVSHKISKATSNIGTNMPRKYNRYRYIDHKINNTDRTCDLKPLEDILITVRIYEPFLYKRGQATQRKPRLSQEFFVLGRQKLTELRDKIYCHCQFGPFNDISDDFDSIKKTQIEVFEEIPSKEDGFGFFFITDTFYNDYRTSNTDYTVETRDWMSRQENIGPVQVKSMHDTRFEDLNLRVGFPQVYRHYINCEHIVSFSDIRLVAADDSLKSTDYPLLRCVSSTRTTLCMICGITEASFVVKNNTNHISDPTFLCQSCLISFHYIDGKKSGTFKAFRYYGNRPIIMNKENSND